MATYGIGFQVISRPPNFNSTSDRLDIANFDVFGAPYNQFAFAWPNSSTTSSECALWMCIQAYQVTTKTSNQEQSVVEKFHNINHLIESDDFSGADLFYFDALPAELNPAPGANYSVGIMASLFLIEYLGPLVNGTVILNLESQSPSSDFIQAIWNGTENLDAWIQNLALSMTNVVRVSTPAHNNRYNGTAFRQGINVRWMWLVLPAAMVMFSVLIFGLVIIKTMKSNVEAWKGSPLTLLFSDVDAEIKGQAGGELLGTVKGLERGVGRRRVVLDSQADGRLLFRAVG